MSFVSKVAGATSTGKRSAGLTLRADFTRKGMTSHFFDATSTRRIFPPAQNTIDFASRLHAIDG